MKSTRNLTTIILVLTATILMLTQTQCSKKSEENPPAPSLTVTDIDGNVYHTVVIGTQTWMVENLKVTKYRNGDPIANVTDNILWRTLTTGAYCWYNNEVANKTVYGALYNWFAVSDARNIAPAGWHVPTDADWTTLTNFLGGINLAGGKMKESGTTHWGSPNSGTNESGLTILPGGSRSDDGSFVGIQSYANIWSSNEFDATQGWQRELNKNESIVYRFIGKKVLGFTIRLVKD